MSKDAKKQGLSEETKKKAEFFEHMSYYKFNGPIGGITNFNMEYGFLEARVRGFRSGFLRAHEYKELMRCTTLDELKLSLTDTDYGQFVATISKVQGDGSNDDYARRLYQACYNKFLGEFEYMRLNATGLLQSFLDYLTYSPMISNFCTLIAAIQNSDQPEKVLKKADPVGRYPHLNSIIAFDKKEDLLTDLFDTLLVDTPVSKYFWQYFLPEMESMDDQKDDAQTLKKLTVDVELDIMKTMLQKYWLEDFYNYCREIGGETWVVMKQLLEFEADRMTLECTINSFDSPLNEPDRHDHERKMLYPNFGKLYPDGQRILTGRRDKPGVSDFATLGNEYKGKQVDYMELLQDEDNYIYQMMRAEANILKMGFESQGHFGCFYAFYKLKLLELKNLKLILDIVSQDRKPEERREMFKGVTTIFE